MTIEIADLISSQANQSREYDIYSLPELFLENTKIHEHNGKELARRVLQFINDPRKTATALQNCKSYPAAEKVKLPPPKRLARTRPTFHEVITKRRSARFFPDKPAFVNTRISLRSLGLLLFYGYGVSMLTKQTKKLLDQENNEEQLTSRFRTAPSGGGLYPLELYCVALNVRKLEPGIYHYNVFEHKLETLSREEKSTLTERVTSSLTRGANYENVGMVIITTAIPLRTVYKYGDRGYRFLLLEAGHVAQNICLGAEALGLSICSLGGFFDDQLHQILNIDGLDELVVNVIVGGIQKK